MTKEEILEKSRSENKNADVYDVEVQNKAARAGVYFGAELALILNIISIIFFHHFCIEALIMFFGMEAAVFCVKFLKMHKKHELLVFIIYGFLFMASVAGWVFQMANA